MLPSTGLVELLAPTRCLACRRRGPAPWCPACAAQVRTSPGGCRRCGIAARPGHPCWPPEAPIAGTLVALDYRGPVAAAIVTAKIGGAHAGWRPFGRLLAERVAVDPPAVDAVTWVTTGPRRRRARGIDHAQQLASAVAAALALPLVATLVAGPSAGGRRGDGRDAYRATGPLPGTDLLLVDDILTTGRTAVRAANVLVAAGAARPHLAVLARAGPHHLVGRC